MIIDVAGFKYNLSTNKSINIGFRSLGQFKKDFSTTNGYSSDTINILSKYMRIHNQDFSKISSPDRGRLLAILINRANWLQSQPNFKSTTLINSLFKSSYETILGIISKLTEKEEKEKPKVDQECEENKKKLNSITQDRLFKLILEFSWLLLHPESVPKDKICDWAKVIKELENTNIENLIESIKTGKTPTSITSQEVKDIQTEVDLQIDAALNPVPAGSGPLGTGSSAPLVTAPGSGPAPPGSAPPGSAPPSPTTVPAPPSPAPSPAPGSAPGSSVTPTTVPAPPVPAPPVPAPPASSVTPALTGTPSTTLTGVTPTEPIKDHIKTLLNYIKIGELLKGPLKQGGAKTEKIVDKSLVEVTLPLFDYFKDTYPIYSFLESCMKKKSKKTVLLLLKLLHICNNIKKKGIYRIKNVDTSVLSFINHMSKCTQDKIETSNIPKVHFSTLLKKGVRKNYNVRPHLQFLRLDKNLRSKFFNRKDIYILYDR